MKRIICLLMVSMLVAVSVSSTVFGMPYDPSKYTSVNEVSALLPSNVKQSRAAESTKTRGEFFMSADPVAKNNGNGTIGALAIAFTSVLVDEAYMSTHLDQQDEKTERWRQVDYCEAGSYSESYPEGLEMPTTGILFIDQPRGYYYRLRGVFGVVYNGAFEAFNPTIDGVLLDQHNEPNQKR